MSEIDTTSKKDVEERIYLVCVTDNHTDSWSFCKGRTEAYEVIKDYILHDWDISDASFVLVESCTLSQRKSIVAFMKYVQEFYDDGFDINDYYSTDEEYEVHYYNEVEPEFDNADRVDMASIMDGDIVRGG